MMLIGLVFALNGLSSPDPVALDQVRITAHLRQTEADLRARDVSHLSDAQRRARAENLDALHRYWVRGVYPHNTDIPRTRVPVFIDHGGRACAVGQLMIDSGSADLAQHIARDERLEYLATIETEGVGAWIEASGLTFDELARIQPSYCGCNDEELDPVCGDDGMTYPNECMAVECAGVAVAHVGECEGMGESGDGETEGATSGSEGGSSGDEMGDDPAPEEPTPNESTEDKGCRVGGSGGGGAALLLLALAWRRKR
jgi:hypothetical protein